MFEVCPYFLLSDIVLAWQHNVGPANCGNTKQPQPGSGAAWFWSHTTHSCKCLTAESPEGPSSPVEHNSYGCRSVYEEECVSFIVSCGVIIFRSFNIRFLSSVERSSDTAEPLFLNVAVKMAFNLFNNQSYKVIEVDSKRVYVAVKMFTACPLHEPLYFLCWSTASLQFATIGCSASWRPSCASFTFLVNRSNGKFLFSRQLSSNSRGNDSSDH